MPRQRSIESLSSEELRRLLMEKQREERSARLDHFRRTGRLVNAPTSADKTVIEPSLIPMIVEQDIPDSELRTRIPRKRLWMDRALLLVEIIAFIGLVFVVLNGVTVLRNLNAEVVSSLNQPTAEPTALIGLVVLPSGHTPPTSPGGAQPNEAEIPEHLRAVVQMMASVPVPTSSPEQAQHIRIPSIGVDQIVVQGDGWEQLKKGVGQQLGTADPGETGNMVLSAHNDIYGETFRYLDRLEPGDEVFIRTTQREYIYVVDQIQIVDPSRVDLLAQTPEAILTMISCYPYMVDNQRIVVTAHLQGQP